jgi:hypothetical protein
MKRCPSCKSLMPEDVHKCIRCGFDSTPAVVPPAPNRGRIGNGWALAKQSFRVLFHNKRLLVFPLLSGVSVLLVIASFVGGAWASGLLGRDENVGEATAWIVGFAWYFANYFVIVFFNCALVACARESFRGGQVTVGGGLRAASRRLPHIIAWALAAASVGMVLRAIEERVALVGKIVIALIGIAWTLATYFVVPVLVFEDLGPIDAAKRSAAILKKTWGETIVGNAGIGLVTFFVTLAALVVTVFAFGALALKLGSLVVAITGAALVVAIILLASLIGSALNSIALCALYVFATEGKVPQAFAGAGLEHAFAARGASKTP